MFGLVLRLANRIGNGHQATAWIWFLASRSWLAFQGRLPWNLMAFLDDAHKRGVLRQVGAVYQFRHARLQDRLTGPPADKPRDT